MGYSVDEPQKLLQLRESVQEKIGRLRTVMDTLELYELASASPAEPARPLGSGTRPRQHVEVHNYGSLGTLNTGEVLGSIHSRASTVAGVSAEDFREAITAFARVIGENRDLPEERRGVVLESVDLVAEEASRPPEKRRLRAVHALLAAIPGAIAMSGGAIEAWDRYGATIRAYLGL